MDDTNPEERVDKAVRLSFARKLGYGLGSSASNFTWQMVSFYLLFFYTDVFGISAAAVGTILLATRIFDGFNDLVEGHIVDRTRSRWGRLRPYLLFGSVPIALILVLTFSTPALSPSGKIAYAATTYVLLGVAYSFLTIAHSALMASMTQDTNERSSLASLTMISIYSTILIVAVATMPLVNSFASQQTGFTMTAAIYGVLAVGLYLTCFASTREVKSGQAKRHSFKEELRLIAQNKFLLILLIAIFFTQAANDMRTTAAIFFFKYDIGNESFYPLFMMIMILSMIAGASFTPLLGRKLGSKRNLYIIGTLVVIVSGAMVLFTPYENLPLITVSLAVSSVGIGITYVMIRSMLADTVEYGEWKTGIRGEGIIFSTFGVTNKLGYAVGGSLSAFLLASVGYVPNVAQSQQAQTIILYMVTLFPIIAGALAVGIMLFYKVDDRCYTRILREIRERSERTIE
jgi:sugar (glycoside-pentoside-hexuronide) transporter